MLDAIDATCEPSEIPVVGALIDSVPDVSVKDAGVAALAGTTMPMLKAPTATAAERKTNVRVIGMPYLSYRNERLQIPR